jgi:glycosyltransferase involved in cell wall biosynthesis
MYRGGAEAQVVALIRESLKRGYAVNLIVLKPIEGFSKELSELNVNCHSMNINLTIVGLFQLVRSFFSYIRITRKFNPNIIHSHMSWANIYTRILSFFCQPHKTICTAHNTYEGGRLLSYLYRLTNSFSDLNTNVSQVSLDHYLNNKSFFKKDSCVIYNGVSPQKQKSISFDSNSFKWLAIGRLVQQKRYDVMLKVFSIHIKTYPNDTLTILGDGKLFGHLTSLLNDLGLESSVKFMGSVDDVEKYIALSHIMLMTSQWEGLPLSIIETVSAARPVIATNVGGISEICPIGPAFQLPLFDVCDIVNAMNDVRSMPHRDLSLNADENGMLVSAKFDIEKIFDEWELVYAS